MYCIARSLARYHDVDVDRRVFQGTCATQRHVNATVHSFRPSCRAVKFAVLCNSAKKILRKLTPDPFPMQAVLEKDVVLGIEFTSNVRVSARDGLAAEPQHGSLLGCLS